VVIPPQPSLAFRISDLKNTNIPHYNTEYLLTRQGYPPALGRDQQVPPA
jgi:hypothetical protein